MRQRIRAPLRFAVPPNRTSQHGVPLRSDATASRRVAVKLSVFGSPHNSPMTAARPEHLTPSSIAHSASRASRASTWTRLDAGSPGGWTRPLSRIAILSCTHSSGLVASSWARRNPAQLPSRGCAAKISDRVGLGGAGKRHGSPSPEGRRGCSAGRERGKTAPPATRDRSLATRLISFSFYFCSFLATHRQESMARLAAIIPELPEAPGDPNELRPPRSQ